MNESRWQSLEEKVDEILKNTAKHTQKLDSLNSKVATNREKINKNEEDIVDNWGKIKLASGALGFVTFLGTVVAIYTSVFMG